MNSEISAQTSPLLTEASDKPEALDFTSESVIRDYRVAYQSRQISLLGRREVLTGKAKFGIFGDGKEVPQLAMARAFRKGDFRAGYYRDQTFMLAVGALSIEEFFAQLYAHADAAAEPSSGGRQMNGHFATHLVRPDGSWGEHTAAYNSSADLSPTASQMPRLVGLAYASRLYRELPELASFEGFSKHGDEIAFGTIGDASCAEGLFWESVNAVGVLGAPMLLSIWDDGYGISVPNRLQITKANLSEALQGFQRQAGGDSGLELFRVQGWDYPALCQTYLSVADLVRRDHVPAIIHVTELTQPQGHSTSGSHERYKSPERLEWEAEHDCLARMRQWMLAQELVAEGELERYERQDLERVSEARIDVWKSMRGPIDAELKSFVSLASQVAGASPVARERVEEINATLLRKQTPQRRDILASASETLIAVHDQPSPARDQLVAWQRERRAENRRRYGSHLYCETEHSVLAVPSEPARFDADAPMLRGFEILNRCFDAALARNPRVIAFGEDVGQLGDVNQGFSGLQEKYGPLRVADTGIREATIAGQAIGMAQRGLRPIAEIQYLDYILYALQILSDDLATLSYRTLGTQRAPVIIRTRGHRLEGIWHSGSPMAALIHLLRGMVICVPRDMTRAAGFYNTLLRAEEPALVIEVLNGYRLREKLPANLESFTLPVGVPEILREGTDATLVTYGACCRIAEEAAELLAATGIEVEILDVQTLLPFDREARIVRSLRKTNRILFVDEDVPGGATAYMMREVLEGQGGFQWLDAAPRTVCGAPHRPAYGSDGDYFSKPSRESIFEAVYDLMHEADPRHYPAFMAEG